MLGLDQIAASVAGGDAAVVFPDLSRALEYWKTLALFIQERHRCQPRFTHTACVFGITCYSPRIMRLWVPHFLINEERTMPMDWIEQRTGFELVSPYFSARELRRLNGLQ